jgi:hypothetical protein
MLVAAGDIVPPILIALPSKLLAGWLVGWVLGGL